MEKENLSEKINDPKFVWTEFVEHLRDRHKENIKVFEGLQAELKTAKHSEKQRLKTKIRNAELELQNEFFFINTLHKEMVSYSKKVNDA